MPADERGYFVHIFWPGAVIVGALLAWEMAVRAFGVRSIILPPPSEILYVMGTLPLLLTHLWPSLCTRS
jgi:ABC-type nitrate/sulfonate/bicarbonate transport system permease component